MNAVTVSVVVQTLKPASKTATKNGAARLLSIHAETALVAARAASRVAGLANAWALQETPFIEMGLAIVVVVLTIRIVAKSTPLTTVFLNTVKKVLI